MPTTIQTQTVKEFTAFEKTAIRNQPWRLAIAGTVVTAGFNLFNFMETDFLVTSLTRTPEGAILVNLQGQPTPVEVQAENLTSFVFMPRLQKIYPAFIPATEAVADIHSETQNNVLHFFLGDRPATDLIATNWHRSSGQPLRVRSGTC